ncbi:MAG: small ribosomal subunit biogenesis GTPase RsgA [Elainella sp. Prado103]|jgi:ribosome biogenesis GTPase|nr:small ribosomal subunit biogenesis GTPase RsgA [Elainella sp. Prado103]
MGDGCFDPPDQGHSDAALLGTVLAVQANYYWVRLAQTVRVDVSSEPIEFLLCTRRTRLKKIGQQVMVGDRVQVEEPDWSGHRGAITQVLPRQTQLDRPPIANVDQILLVFALAEPALDPVQLSRFLIKAESTGLQISLTLNKADLLAVDTQVSWQQRLQQWGYNPMLLSLQHRQGLAAIQTQLDRRITVVSGPSGVGKSSLINALIPKIELRTSTVSGKLGRGRHTTRHVELFELPTGGLLADTPGFNQPDLTCGPAELARYFPEARQRLEQAACQFSNCLHRDEPNCVVRGDWERYTHYLTFLEEAILYQQAIDRRGEEESTLKVKSKGNGLRQSEPKLAAKKYRRPSRRTEKQTLRELYQDSDDQDAD